MNKILEETKQKNIEIFKRDMPFMIAHNTRLIEYLSNIGYFTAPSSSKSHGAWIGGNFNHSLKVTETLLLTTAIKHLKWSRPESPYIIGMFHDLCKSDARNFIFDLNGNCIIVKNHKCDHRHAEKSLYMIKNFINLTLEEKLCIYYHMGEHGDDYEYRVLMEKIIKNYPNIVETQLADSYAALICKV